MHRRLRVLLPVLGIGVASTLLLSSCGETDIPSAAAAVAAEPHASQALDRADEPTTTTTTAPPTTTTTAPPPTTAAPKPTTRSSSGSTSRRKTTTVVATPAPQTASTSSCTEAGLLSSINRERANHGLPALALRGGATSVACSWSKHMTSSGLGHNGNLTGDLAAHGVTGWRAVGENVGYGSSPGQVFGLFMGSSGHRANILNDGYSQVGIGVVKAGSRVWVTFDFVGY